MTDGILWAVWAEHGSQFILWAAFEDFGDAVRESESIRSRTFITELAIHATSP